VEYRTAKFGIRCRCIFDSCSAQFGSSIIVHWQQSGHINQISSTHIACHFGFDFRDVRYAFAERLVGFKIALQQNEILPFAPPSQVLSAMNFIRSCLFTSDGSRRKKLPPHSERLRFRAFVPRCPGRRSLPPEPIRIVFRTVRYLQFLAGSLYSCFQRQLY